MDSEQVEVNVDSSFLILTLSLPTVAVPLLLDDVKADRIKEDDNDVDEFWLFKPMILLLLKSNGLELDIEERSLQLACFFCTCELNLEKLAKTLLHPSSGHVMSSVLLCLLKCTFKPKVMRKNENVLMKEKQLARTAPKESATSFKEIHKQNN